jgi:hypothetical protein
LKGLFQTVAKEKFIAKDFLRPVEDWLARNEANELRRLCALGKRVDAFSGSEHLSNIGIPPN